MRNASRIGGWDGRPGLTTVRTFAFCSFLIRGLTFAGGSFRARNGVYYMNRAIFYPTEIPHPPLAGKKRDYLRGRTIAMAMDSVLHGRTECPPLGKKNRHAVSLIPPLLPSLHPPRTHCHACCCLYARGGVMFANYHLNNYWQASPCDFLSLTNDTGAKFIPIFPTLLHPTLRVLCGSIKKKY